MSKKNGITELSKTLALIERSDGWWLWDETRSMNLAMKEKTAQDAFVEALTYYQDRLGRVETEHGALSKKVDAFVAQFVAQFVDEEDDE